MLDLSAARSAAKHPSKYAVVSSARAAQLIALEEGQVIISNREELPTLKPSPTTSAGSELDHRVQRPLGYLTNML
jgi:hypothetical protein